MKRDELNAPRFFLCFLAVIIPYNALLFRYIVVNVYKRAPDADALEADGKQGVNDFKACPSVRAFNVNGKTGKMRRVFRAAYFTVVLFTTESGRKKKRNVRKFTRLV